MYYQRRCERRNAFTISGKQDATQRLERVSWKGIPSAARLDSQKNGRDPAAYGGAQRRYIKQVAAGNNSPGGCIGALVQTECQSGQVVGDICSNPHRNGREGRVDALFVVVARIPLEPSHATTAKGIDAVDVGTSAAIGAGPDGAFVDGVLAVGATEARRADTTVRQLEDHASGVVLARAATGTRVLVLAAELPDVAG